MYRDDRNFASPEVREQDIWSKDRFVAWLEKQPAGGAYDYFGYPGKCLLHQYLESCGRAVAFMGTAFVNGKEPIPASFNSVARDWPRTFGAALERARKMLP